MLRRSGQGAVKKAASGHSAVLAGNLNRCPVPPQSPFNKVRWLARRIATVVESTNLPGTRYNSRTSQTTAPGLASSGPVPKILECERASIGPTSANLATHLRPLLRVYPTSPSNTVTLAQHRTLPRLSQVHRHLHSFNSNYQLSAVQVPERLSAPSTDKDILRYPAVQHARTFSTSTPAKKDFTPKMSNQAPHPAVLIPGPVEFSDEVLGAMSTHSESHVGPQFVNIFGETLKMLRQVFQTTDPASQPFVISGSGTLGWDQVAANLAEPGDEVLVLHTGYFADSFADCFETYGAKATQLKAPIGDRPQLDEIEKALKEKKYKLLTVTHVDTSTGVLSEIKALSELVHRVSPGTLLVVDGVCSVGCEEIRFDDWKIDVVITASQKALGAPAGLSVLMASGAAMEVFKKRTTRPTSYFGSWKNWLPIMQNYENKKPSYFATPSPQLVRALHTSLTQILSVSLDSRFAAHKKASQKVKEAVAALGLKQLASKPENQANGMTAIYLPEGMTPPDVLPSMAKKGVVFAGGLHKEIASKYIRFGHMGVSVTDPNRPDIEKGIEALKEALSEAGYKAPN